MITINDQVELPSGRPLISDILHAGVRLLTRETKVIGNKAVFKGGAILSVLYSTEDGEGPAISTWEQEIPFSQIVEMDQPVENAMVTMNMLLMGLEIGVEAPARVIDVELQIEVQVQAVASEQLEMLTDAYSTRYHVLPELRDFTLTDVSEQFSTRAQVRETSQIQPPIHSILDTEVQLSPVNCHTEDGQSKLSCDATVRVLYLTDDNDYETASFTLPVDTMLENPDYAQCVGAAYVAGDVFSGVSADGMEVRFNVAFEGEMRLQRQLKVVEEIKGDWENPKEHETGSASVVLRRVSGNETLWDIAKGYSTTQKDILAANAMEEASELNAGALLLIPRKR